MADLPLPNIPYRTPMLDESGFLTQPWAAFFRALYIRVGQANALTNTELEAISSGAEFEAELQAIAATVALNKASADQEFDDLNQGPVL